MKNLVFLGGTCGNNSWRDGLIARLTAAGVAPESLFNPVVDDWNEACQAKEDQVKLDAGLMLYYLGDPQDGAVGSISLYSTVEAVMALYDDPTRTVVVIDANGLEGHALKAVKKTEKDLRRRFPDAPIFGTLAEAEVWLVSNLT